MCNSSHRFRNIKPIILGFWCLIPHQLLYIIPSRLVGWLYVSSLVILTLDCVKKISGYWVNTHFGAGWLQLRLSQISNYPNVNHALLGEPIRCQIAMGGKKTKAERGKCSGRRARPHPSSSRQAWLPDPLTPAERHRIHHGVLGNVVNCWLPLLGADLLEAAVCLQVDDTRPGWGRWRDRLEMRSAGAPGNKWGRFINGISLPEPCALSVWWHFIGLRGFIYVVFLPKSPTMTLTSTRLL